MGATDSRFWYYPGATADGRTPLQPVDLGRRAALVEEEPAPVDFGVSTLGGLHVVQTWAVDLLVTVRVEGIPDGSTQKQLHALCNHLRRGGLCGFALDASRFFAATRRTGLSVDPGSDLSGVVLTGPYWYSWNTSPTVTNGSVAVEGFDGERMLHAISSLPAYDSTYANVVLDGNLEFPVTDFLIRERYSYPALRLTPEGRRAPLLTSRLGHTWALDLPLQVDRHALRNTVRSLPGTNGKPATVGTPYAPRR